MEIWTLCAVEWQSPNSQKSAFSQSLKVFFTGFQLNIWNTVWGYQRIQELTRFVLRDKIHHWLQFDYKMSEKQRLLTEVSKWDYRGCQTEHRDSSAHQWNLVANHSTNFTTCRSIYRGHVEQLCRKTFSGGDVQVMQQSVYDVTLRFFTCSEFIYLQSCRTKRVTDLILRR